MSRKDDIKELIIEHHRQLQKLRQQAAAFGLYTPSYILTEIEDKEAEIKKLRMEFESLGDSDVDEKIQRVLQLARYLESVVNELPLPAESESLEIGTWLSDPAKIFIPLKCTAEKDATDQQDIFTFLKDQFKECRTVLLIGNYGAGKSFLTQKILLEKVEASRIAASNDTSFRLPVYYQLKDFYGQEPDLIIRKLLKHLKANGLTTLTQLELERMLKNGELLCILDGFDEIPFLFLYSTAMEKMQQLLNYLDVGDNQTLITSRPGIFTNELENNILSNLPSVAYISSWDDNTWLEYLRECEKQGWRFDGSYYKFYQIVRSNSVLHELTTTPLYCRMLVETSRKIATDPSIIDVTGLYTLYIENFLEKERERSIIKEPQVKLDLLMATATGMLEKERIRLRPTELDQALAEHAQHISSHELRAFAEKDTYTYSFLVSDRENMLSFSHKSFYEYFVALKAFTEIKAHFGEARFGLLASYNLTEEIVTFLAGLLTTGEEIDFAEELPKLFQGSDPLGALGISEHNTILLRNLMLLQLAILHLVQDVSLIGIDLSRIRLSSEKGVNQLHKVKLDSSNLIGSDLRGVSLRGSSLRMAQLNRCLLDDADLRDVDLTEAKLQNISCQQTRFYGACFRGISVRKSDVNLIKSAIYWEKARFGTEMNDTWVSETVTLLDNLALPD